MSARGCHAGREILQHVETGWQTRASASLGADSGLMGVAAATHRLAWAVGFRASGRTLRPVSERWDGSAWTAVSVPSSAVSEALVDVGIAPDRTAWAVGYRSTSNGPTPVVLHRVGSQWVRLDPKLSDGWFGSLVAIDASGADGAWAVGWMGDGGALRPLLLHRTATTWDVVHTGLTPSAETVLTGVRRSPDGTVAVVGYSRVGTATRGLLWRSGSWGWRADADLASIPGSLLPDDVAFDPTSAPVVVGGYRAPGPGGYRAFIAQATPGGWRLERDPGGVNPFAHLRSVLATDEAFAVGWTSRAGVAIETCGALSPAPTSSRGAGRDRAGRVRAARPAGARVAGEPGDRPDSATRRSAQRRADGRAARSPGAPRSVAGITFRDVAVDVGLDMVTKSYGATALDIDGDGWMDLLISQHTTQGRLLRNDRGTFVAAIGDPLPTHDRHGCAAADVDGDLRDDAFCAIGAARGMRIKTNELWLDLGTADQRQASAAFGVDDPLARGRRATFLDLDGDPFPDLLVTSDPIRVDGLPSLDRAFRNDGGTRFLPAPRSGLELPVGGSCVLSADLDGDGDEEVLLCTEEPWGGARGSHVFRRVGGRFRLATSSVGVTPSWDVDAAAADLDGDERADLVQHLRDPPRGQPPGEGPAGARAHAGCHRGHRRRGRGRQR